MTAPPNPFRQALDRAAGLGFVVCDGPRGCLIITSPDGRSRLILMPLRVAEHSPLVLANTITRFVSAARRGEARHAPQTA